MFLSDLLSLFCLMSSMAAVNSGMKKPNGSMLSESTYNNQRNDPKAQGLTLDE